MNSGDFPIPILFILISLIIVKSNEVSLDTVLITVSSTEEDLKNNSRLRREISLKNHEDCGMVKTRPPSRNKFTSFLQELVAGNILDKKIAFPGEQPWIAALVVMKQGQMFYCGASLIDHLHILTSASCVARMNSKDLTELEIILGAFDIYNPLESGRIVSKVAKVAFHKGFDSIGMENNIAIVKLKEPVSYTDRVQPICLSNRTNIIDSLATLGGWGQLLFDPLRYLHKLDVRIWDHKRCIKKYNQGKNGYFPEIQDDSLCAGSPVPTSKNLCQGNNGSPLILKRNGRFELIGITSFGAENFPCVFTRLDKFIPWIMRNIKNF